MSNQFIVSARKYRPQTFDTVVGQEHITSTLKNAIKNNQLAHAFLFCGPRGVGKTTCARILAKTLNCDTPTSDIEPCGECPSCKASQSNTSFNVFELDAASNNSVEDIRELNEQVRFSPQQGKYKIYIIDEVHMLTTQAFNAFLKTLEEPPAYTIFILATTEKHKILPTILSRCQIFDFKRITTQDTVRHLSQISKKEGVEAEEEALHVIAQKSEGCMRDALSILDKISSFTNNHISYAATMEILNQLDAEFFIKLTDSFLTADATQALLLLDEVLDRGFECDILIQGLAEHFRNLLLCKDARMAKLLDVPQNHKALYYNKAAQCPATFILSGLNILNTTLLEYKNSNNKRLHTELSLIRLCYLLYTSEPNLEVEKKNSDLISNTSEHNTNITHTEINTPITSSTTIENTKTETASEPKTTTVLTTQEPQKEIPKTSTTLERTSTSRRISKGMLQNIPTTIATSENTTTSQPLSLELILPIVEIYKEKLKEENKSILYNSFNNAQISIEQNGSLHLKSSDRVNDSYLQGERSNLQDFLKAQLGQTVSISHSFDQSLEPTQEKVLSKSEIFELMAQKNPILQELKTALNLSIEY